MEKELKIVSIYFSIKNEGVESVSCKEMVRKPKSWNQQLTNHKEGGNEQPERR